MKKRDSYLSYVREAKAAMAEAIKPPPPPPSPTCTALARLLQDLP